MLILCQQRYSKGISGYSLLIYVVNTFLIGSKLYKLRYYTRNCVLDKNRGSNIFTTDVCCYKLACAGQLSITRQIIG